MNAFFVFAANYFFVLPVLILGIYFLLQKWPAHKNMAIFAIPSALLAGLLGLIGNHVYYDPRPFVVGHFTPLIAHAADNGFPSDHTLLASAAAMIAWYWNKKLGILLWLITIVVAVARVYVGVHHATDVIGSMAFSIIGVSAVYWLFVYGHKEII